MGVLYADDISGKTLEKSEAFTVEITKFEENGRLQKSKKLYCSLESLTKVFGSAGFGWTVLEKNPQTGKWGKVG